MTHIQHFHSLSFLSAFPQESSKGFKDFCVRNINQAAFGRREIEIAEQGEDMLETTVPMDGLRQVTSTWLTLKEQKRNWESRR